MSDIFDHAGVAGAFPLGMHHTPFTEQEQEHIAYLDHLCHKADDENKIAREQEEHEPMTLPPTISASALPPNTHAIEVTFEGSGRKYTYLSAFPCERGDLVVVLVRGEYKVVQVASNTGTFYKPDVIAYKWLICKVDFTQYDKVKDTKLVP